MTATVIVSLTGLPLQLAMGIALGIALGVLIAQLCAPRVKKFVAVGLLAVLLACAIDARMRASEDLVILNPCDRWPAWSLPWIVAGCMWP